MLVSYDTEHWHPDQLGDTGVIILDRKKYTLIFGNLKMILTPVIG